MSAQHRLYIAGFGSGHNEFLIGDEILERHVAFVGDDPAATPVPVLVLDRGEFLGQDRPAQFFGIENRLEFCDVRHQVVVLRTELVCFQSGETTQRHVEDVVRLDLRQLERRHEGAPGVLNIFRVADDLDDLVDVVESDQQTLRRCGPGLRPS